TAVALSGLVPPATAPLPVGTFSPTNALQASPLPGATAATIEYAYSDNIGRLLHGHQPNPDAFDTVQWTVVSGTEAFTGVPSLNEQADGRLQVAAHNANGPVWANTQATKSPPAWSTWQPLETPMAFHPVTGRLADGRLVAFAVGPGGVLWALPQVTANGPYTSWISLGVAGLAGTPAVATVGDGIRIFVRDASGVFRTMTYSGGAVTGCTGVSEAGFTGTPAVVVYPGGRLRLFARGSDGTILTKKQDGTGTFPDAWDQVSGFVAAGAPSALISPASGRTEIVARGVDGLIYNTGETTQGSGVWRPWTKATFEVDPSATDPTAFTYTNANGPGWAFAFRNSDNQSRVYVLRTTSSPAEAGKEGKFTRHALPGPPR
ncbi:hypothetical protein ACFQ08_33215, partial [Streptosporangium algeriense]